MIVVALIAIVMAVALPSLLNARKSAVESAVIGRLRTLVTVNEQYRTRYGRYANGYASLWASGLIDIPAFFAIDGYNTVYLGSSFTWECRAWPWVFGTYGDRAFYVETSGVIRFAEGAMADQNSPPIE